jgi:peptidoglycan hydrolase FlgJ
MKLDSIQKINPTPQADKEQVKLKKACEEFEAILTTYLFKSMRQTVTRAESEGRDQTQEIYEGMMDETVANQLSHQSGLGLSKLLYQQLASRPNAPTGSVDLPGADSSGAETAATTVKSRPARG